MLRIILLSVALSVPIATSAPLEPADLRRQWGNWGGPQSTTAPPVSPVSTSAAPPVVPPPPLTVPVASSAVGTPPPASAPPASAPPPPPGGGGGGETHAVQLVNNCGSGEAVFFYEGDRTKTGSKTVSGQLHSGAAWIQGFAGANCMDSGVNCGLVEFSLLNGAISSADYSLLDGPGLGNHKFTYAMHFAYTGSCSNDPGPCTGPSPDQCPNAYWGSDTGGGIPLQCQGDNLGITITFC